MKKSLIAVLAIVVVVFFTVGNVIAQSDQFGVTVETDQGQQLINAPTTNTGASASAGVGDIEVPVTIEDKSQVVVEDNSQTTVEMTDGDVTNTQSVLIQSESQPPFPHSSPGEAPQVVQPHYQPTSKPPEYRTIYTILRYGDKVKKKIELDDGRTVTANLRRKSFTVGALKNKLKGAANWWGGENVDVMPAMDVERNCVELPDDTEVAAQIGFFYVANGNGAVHSFSYEEIAGVENIGAIVAETTRPKLSKTRAISDHVLAAILLNAKQCYGADLVEFSGETIDHGVRASSLGVGGHGVRGSMNNAADLAVTAGAVLGYVSTSGRHTHFVGLQADVHRLKEGQSLEEWE